MEHNSSSGHNMAVLECDGSPDLFKLGSWKGHVLPGAVFIIWGSWWAFNVAARLLWSRRTARFRSQGWYGMAIPGFRLIEPIIKIILPPVAVSIELYFDHTDGYRSLFCPSGTHFAGRFALSHINNWQHTIIYPAFVLSGFVDLVSTRVSLPPGTAHAFLATAFANMAFIMGTHEKHEAQDEMVHWLLFVSMVLTFMFILLEMHTPRNPLPAFGRALATVLQGAWLVQIAKVEFENRIQWEESYGAGAMIAPVYFVFFSIVITASLMVLLAVMAGMRSLDLVPAVLMHDVDRGGHAGYVYPPADVDAEEKALNMDSLHGGGLVRYRNDSAHHSDEGSPRMGSVPFASFEVMSGLAR